MGLFDDIVPPDTVSPGEYRPLRITVRPKGVARPPALPQLDDMSADVGLAPKQAEPWGTSEGGREAVAPPRRTVGLFDDIVAPAMRVRTARFPFGERDDIVGQVADFAPLTGSPMPTNIDPLIGVPIEETSKLGSSGRSVARIGDKEYTQRATHGELDPKHDEEPPDKGPPSDEIKQTNLLAAPRPQGGVSDSAADVTAIDSFNQLAAPELAQSQALTDFVQQYPRAAAAEGALGLGIVLGIPAAGAAGLLGAGAAAATRVAARGRNPFGIGPYAGESIPARSAARNFTAAERAEINRIGAKTGCHTCGTKNPGTKSGNFVLDHQTPSALNRAGGLQRLYPQCKACSDAQGLGIIRLLSRPRGP
jgi:hypothetical protein